MSENVNVPGFGGVSKKTALLGGGLLVGILGIVWYRSKKNAAASAAASAGANTGIDPATGYAYGSAEDAASLSAMGSYQSPTPFYGGSGGANFTTTSNPTSNAQWVQAAVAAMTSAGAVTDATALSAALGKYITGQPASADQQALIQQAIAFENYPPIAGANGYPPAINTTPVSAPLATPTGLKITFNGDTATASWNTVPGAVWYLTSWETPHGNTGGFTGNVTSASVSCSAIALKSGEWLRANVFAADNDYQNRSPTAQTEATRP